MISQAINTEVIGYPSSRGRVAAISPPSGKQLALHFARVFYHDSVGTPAAGQVGLCRLLNTDSLNLYSWNNVVYTALTFPITAASTLIVNAANNGFVLSAKRKFGLIGVNVTQLGTGTLAAQYWNGSAWVALTVLEALSAAGTGIKYLAFLPPPQWVLGGPTGIASDKYAIRVICVAGTSAAVKVDSLWAASWIEFYEAVAANNGVAVQFDSQIPLLLDAGEGIMPYYELATSENGLTVAYSTF